MKKILFILATSFLPILFVLVFPNRSLAVCYSSPISGIICSPSHPLHCGGNLCCDTAQDSPTCPGYGVPAGKSCGSNELPCCNPGELCDDGWVCNDRTFTCDSSTKTTTCGDQGLPCCSGEKCKFSLTCDTSNYSCGSGNNNGNNNNGSNNNWQQ